MCICKDQKYLRSRMAVAVRQIAGGVKCQVMASKIYQSTSRQ